LLIADLSAHDSTFAFLWKSRRRPVSKNEKGPPRGREGPFQGDA
jgi:hypothetical protein